MANANIHDLTYTWGG